MEVLRQLTRFSSRPAVIAGGLTFRCANWTAILADCTLFACESRPPLHINTLFVFHGFPLLCSWSFYRGLQPENSTDAFLILDKGAGTSTYSKVPALSQTRSMKPQQYSRSRKVCCACAALAAGLMHPWQNFKVPMRLRGLSSGTSTLKLSNKPTPSPCGKQASSRGRAWASMRRPGGTTWKPPGVPGWLAASQCRCA